MKSLVVPIELADQLREYLLSKPWIEVNGLLVQYLNCKFVDVEIKEETPNTTNTTKS